MTIGEILEWANSKYPTKTAKEWQELYDELFIDSFCNGASKKQSSAKMFIIGCALFDKNLEESQHCMQGSKNILRDTKITQNDVDIAIQKIIKDTKHEMLFD